MESRQNIQKVGSRRRNANLTVPPRSNEPLQNGLWAATVQIFVRWAMNTLFRHESFVDNGVAFLFWASLAASVVFVVVANILHAYGIIEIVCEW